LLEAVGAISKGDSQRARSRAVNYQDIAFAPRGNAADNDAAIQDNEEDVEDVEVVEDELVKTKNKSTEDVFSAIEKVCITLLCQTTI
jgi:hypothetical protein